MKLLSWNVNGIRSCIRKGFLDFVVREDPDILCLQETKIQADQIPFELEGYHHYWNFAEKKGYSGTAILTKQKPLNVFYGLGIEEHDREGRVITLEFEKVYFLTVYTPNSQRGLTRLEYRMKWEDDFLSYLRDLDSKKPVIFCGDLNVAHKEIDLKNPGSNTKNAGFTPEEREKFSNLLKQGFLDTFRYFYPEQTEAYTWWSYMFKAREKNIGWRIDYFCVSERLKDELKDALIYSDVYGSDHCPIGLLLKKKTSCF
ncbi:MAG: exodeoxyribonuclease III [Desulfitobacteriia bacterium]|jgi:exodeoxyribonuclease-3